ncbi:MAG: hypothetical protein Pg6B_10170 [Candidatus Azobacteroides pseudotrichonymphae]|jgi:hypothetical protein|nr:MAG: hypothetical protein Pg6B_10170 [Candidatus Azobacteroides pseudotrichonymphae]
MKKLTLTIAIFLFLIAPLGAGGTVIYMRHPALETTIDRAWFWDNELTIKMTNGREFYNKSEWGTCNILCKP